MKLPGIAWNWTLLHCLELWSCVDTTEVIVSDWCDAGARPNENLSVSFPCHIKQTFHFKSLAETMSIAHKFMCGIYPEASADHRNQQAMNVDSR